MQENKVQTMTQDLKPCPFCGGGWQPIETAPSHREVYISFKRNKYSGICKAIFFPKNSEEYTGEDLDFVDYDDQQDNYFLPEGWYEVSEFQEYSYWLMDETPTHWMPLPQPPKGKIMKLTQEHVGKRFVTVGGEIAFCFKGVNGLFNFLTAEGGAIFTLKSNGQPEYDGEPSDALSHCLDERIEELEAFVKKNEKAMNSAALLSAEGKLSDVDNILFDAIQASRRMLEAEL